MDDKSGLERRIAGLTEKLTLKAPSLIVSVLGDSIAPHGGTFWMGSLIRLMAPFGINERLVRTSAFRLTRENWLTSRQVGRRSYYSLTPVALKRFEEAFHRVYEYQPEVWDGTWSLVLVDPTGLAQDERDRIRQALHWLGFGMAAPFVFVHTAMAADELSQTLSDHDLAARSVVMTARLDDADTADAAAAFPGRCWDLARMAMDYRRFIGLFEPFAKIVETRGACAPEQAFRVRTLLIHEFRRITLRDPQLPPELMPADWEGTAARRLTRDIYRAVSPGTEEWLRTVVETADGPLSEAVQGYYDRFDGLRPAGTY